MRKNLVSIHAGDHFSAVTFDSGDPRSKKMYYWGGNDIIQTVSKSDQVQGSSAEPVDGAYARGGSINPNALKVIDQYTNGSQPFIFQSGYKNIAILQEKWNDTEGK